MQSMGKRKHGEEKVGQDTWKGSYTVEAAVILPSRTKATSLPMI